MACHQNQLSRVQDNLKDLVSEKAVKNSENSLVQKLDEMNLDQGPEKLMASSYQKLEKDAYKFSVQSTRSFGSVISFNKR